MLGQAVDVLGQAVDAPNPAVDEQRPAVDVPSQRPKATEQPEERPGIVFTGGKASPGLGDPGGRLSPVVPQRCGGRGASRFTRGS